MIIKVCGMREPDNISQVATTGIQWMGMIFWPRSSRWANDLSVAHAIPAGIRRVGVFVDQPVVEMAAIADSCRLDIIQLHGHESVECLARLRQSLTHPSVQLMKAISIADEKDIEQVAQYDKVADWLLFDTKCNTVGGSGRKFRWDILENYHGSTPFLLSGGIGPEDIPQLKQFHHPQWKGIDLNPRFETAPGRKDEKRLREFIEKMVR